MAGKGLDDLLARGRPSPKGHTRVSHGAETDVVHPYDPAGRETAGANGPSARGDAPPQPPAPLPSVTGYEVLEELGRGSMGVVYKARQTGVDRLVALKTLRADTRADQEQLERFLAEARVVASLQHPNIVQLYEISL